jgi:hypothetical protein
MRTWIGLKPPDIDEIDLSTVLLAPADPHRRQVVRELARGPKTERRCATFVLPIASAPRRTIGGSCGNLGSSRRPYRPSVSARSIASSAQRATTARPAARAS